jgi:hypothetical protein
VFIPPPTEPLRCTANAGRDRRGSAAGSTDLGRAALLAMLGRIDEAWQLADARSDHLREVRGDSFAGDQYLEVIATIEGDRERACGHIAKMIVEAPPGSEGVMASYRLLLARQLCYLGSIEEAEPWLRQAQGRRVRCGAPGGDLCGRGAPAGRARRARAGGVTGSLRGCSRETATDTVWLQSGLTRTSPRRSSERAESTRRARRSSGRSPSWTESAACQSPVVSRADRLAWAGAGLTTQLTFPYARPGDRHPVSRLTRWPPRRARG